MYLEFTVGRACVADPNLGRIRADFIIERQAGDSGNNVGSGGQVDSAIDPAGIHDVDGEGGIRSTPTRSGAAAGRFEQQSDAIAAGFEVVTVAAQSHLCIETSRPRARSLLGTEKGRGADLGAGWYRQWRVIAGRRRRGFTAIEREANVAERCSIALGLIRQSHGVAFGIG